MKKYLSDLDTNSKGQFGIEWEWDFGGRYWEWFNTEEERQAELDRFNKKKKTDLNWKQGDVLDTFVAKFHELKFEMYKDNFDWILNVNGVPKYRGTKKICKAIALDVCNNNLK